MRITTIYFSSDKKKCSVNSLPPIGLITNHLAARSFFSYITGKKISVIFLKYIYMYIHIEEYRKNLSTTSVTPKYANKFYRVNLTRTAMTGNDFNIMYMKKCIRFKPWKWTAKPQCTDFLTNHSESAHAPKFYVDLRLRGVTYSRRMWKETADRVRNTMAHLLPPTTLTME